MAGRHTHRDNLSGQFARRPVPDIDVTSRFDPVADAIEDVRNVSGAPSPSTIEHPRHAPDADDLAQGGQQRPLRPRTQTVIDASRDNTTEWHALPRPATIAPETMTSAGRAPADEERYLVGDLGGSSGPSYNPGSARLRARNPELVHPDDDGHHNAVLRSAARGSGPGDPSAYLTGLEDGSND